MSGMVPKWNRFEIEIESGEEYENPLQEDGLEATFVSPSGREKVVEGFWDGERMWRVRFAPDEEGEWRYLASLSSGEREEASFVCGTAEGETAFQQHGPVSLSGSKEHLEHADGTPFFWLVDTAWNGPLLASEGDWDWYLKERVRQSFTGVQWVATQWRAAPEGDLEGQVAYEGVEEIAVNPDFFQRLDRRMQALPALKASFAAAKDNFSGLLLLNLVLLLLGFLGGLMCCVPAILLVPIHFMALALVYEDVFPRADELGEPR